MATKSWHQNFKRAPAEQRTGHDGFVYDSKTEMERYYYLQLLEKAGEIRDIRRQVKHQLIATNQYGDDVPILTNKGVAAYTPDFIYHVLGSNPEHPGTEVIEDVKGYRDEASKFRIRVFEALHDEKVIIVRKVGGRWVSE